MSADHASPAFSETSESSLVPPLSPEQLLALLAAADIHPQVFSHPPVFTVEEAKNLRGHFPGAHVKNLFLRNKKGEMWLVVAEEDRPIDLKWLGEALSAGRLSFGSPERLMRHLGVSPGSVTPLAIINDHEGKVRLILDQGVKRHEEINCHPLINDRTISLKVRDLVQFLERHGHPPSWMDFSGASAS